MQSVVAFTFCLLQPPCLCNVSRPLAGAFACGDWCGSLTLRCPLQALKEQETLEQQLRLDRRERHNELLILTNAQEQARLELQETQDAAQRRAQQMDEAVGGCRVCFMQQQSAQLERAAAG